MDDSDERGDSFALEKSPSVDESGKLSNLQSVMSTLAHIMRCASVWEQKNRMTFSKGNLKYPSKAFVDFITNEQTSTEQFNRIREEEYVSKDMRR